MADGSADMPTDDADDTGTGWFCYLLRPRRADILDTGPTEAEAALMGEHWEYTERLHRDGIMTLAGRTLTPGDAFAVMVVRAPDEAAAVALAHGDPGVAGGLFTAAVHPFDLMLLDTRSAHARSVDTATA